MQVGAFFAIGVLLFMTAIFMLGSKTTFFQTYYTLICYFDDISGLRVGAPVHLAGINVGFIHAIDFEDRLEAGESVEGDIEPVSEEPQSRTIVQVKVTMKIDSRYQDRIRADSVASVITQGLLGDRMLFITVGSKDRNALRDGDEIVDVRQPTGFTHLVQKGDALMIDAKKLVGNTNDLVVKLNSVMDEIVAGEGLVHEVIYERDSRGVVRALEDTLAQMKQASGHVAQITGKIDRGQGTLGALVNDDSLYHSVKTLFGKANRNRLVRSVIRYTLQTREKDQLK